MTLTAKKFQADVTKDARKRLIFNLNALILIETEGVDSKVAKSIKNHLWGSILLSNFAFEHNSNQRVANQIQLQVRNSLYNSSILEQIISFCLQRKSIILPLEAPKVHQPKVIFENCSNVQTSIIIRVIRQSPIS